MKRTYPPAEEAVVDKKRKEFLLAHCKQKQSPDNCSRSCDAVDKRWAEEFCPRQPVEPVKNCTLVKKDIQKEIVQKLTSVLLQTQNLVETEMGQPWNAGGDSQMFIKAVYNHFLPGRITVKEAASLIDPRLLSQLKQEHGGLQTLFRNHHQVFVGEHKPVSVSSWSVNN